MNYSANALEVDESSLSFCVNHLNAHPVSHVDTFETMHQFLFKGRIKKTDLPALSKHLIFSGKGPNGYLRP